MPPIAILVALADPTRCRLIELLRLGPQPVHVLAAAFKISRPAISRHLRVLKQSGLISESKFGRENRYSLHPGKLAPVQRWLSGLVPPPKAQRQADVAQTATPALPSRVESEAARAAVPTDLAEPMIVAAPLPPEPTVPVRSTKAAKKLKPAGAVSVPAVPPTSQMGFDF